jgi:hypothetical protein
MLNLLTDSQAKSYIQMQSVLTVPAEITEVVGVPSHVRVISANIATLRNLGAFTNPSKFPEHITAVNLVDLEAEELPTGFLSSCKTVKIVTVQLPKAKVLGNNFLSTCSDLETLIIRDLGALESIGANFCHSCFRLGALNAAGLTSVREIGDSFCRGCDSLVRTNFTGFRAVEVIGENFLMNCGALRIVSLARLANLERVGDRFMYSCTSLIGIQLPPIAHVGSCCLSMCVNLHAIDLTHLCTKIKTVGSGFLAGCESLIDIQFGPLVCLEQLGDFFCSNCVSLAEITMSTGFDVVRIGTNFFKSCTSLETVRLHIPGKPEIADTLFRGCKKLKTALASTKIIRESLPLNLRPALSPMKSQA